MGNYLKIGLKRWIDIEGGLGSNIILKGNSDPEICLSSVALMKRVKPFVALKTISDFSTKGFKSNSLFGFRMWLIGGRVSFLKVYAICWAVFSLIK